MPAEDFHQPATDRWPQQWPEQAGDGDETHDPHQLAAWVGAQHHQPPDRQHQRTAQALHYAGEDQEAKAVGCCAQQRAKAEQQDGAEEDALGAESVGDPA
ncbi:hypothetical protein D3C71_1887790 [compost metagenome]